MTYIRTQEEDSQIFLYTEYSNIYKCKAIRGGVWSKDNKCWMYPISAIDDILQMFPECTSNSVKEVEKAKFSKKELITKIELIRAIKEGNVTPPGIDNVYQSKILYEHQKRCIAIGSMFRRFGFFLKPGTGKTLIGLELIKLRAEDGTALVICPTTIMTDAWENTIKEHSDLSYQVLWAASATRRKNLLRTAYTVNTNILIINFEGLGIILEALKILFSSNNYMDRKLVTLVIDESSKIKAHGTKITANVTVLSEFVENLYLLSGTPAPNGPIEYFPQIRAIDKQLLGTSFYAHRSRYFIQSGYSQFGWDLNGALTEELMNKVASVSVRYTKEECTSLPETVDVVRRVTLSKAEKLNYEEMRKNLVTELQGQDITAQNTVVKIMKLRQITSGFIMANGKPFNIEKQGPKINELDQILDEIGDEQVIIWVQFHWEMDRIAELLKAKKISCSEISGRVSKPNKEIAIAKFKSNGFRVLIAHPRSAGHGLTFVNAGYAIYYSLGYSREEWEQSRDRVHRIGQTRKCTYFIILTKGTVDEVVHKVVLAKIELDEHLISQILGYK